MVPLAADCFQEREVAGRLEAALAAGQTAVLTGSSRRGGGSRVLSGMGGVGKTQLAVAYTRRALADGTAVVWVTASSRKEIVAAYAEAAAALHLPGCDGIDREGDARRFLAWTTATDRSWLVVLDDIQDPADVSGWWPPADAKGKVLATTRRRDAALAGQGRHLVSIDTYTRAEARAYLTERLAPRDRDEPPEQLNGLAADLGFLPLALAQATAYLIDADIAIAAYRRLLAERPLEGISPDSLPDDHQQIVTKTWVLSIDRADAARPAGIARPLLELLSVLDPNGIPDAVLTSRPVLAHLATGDSDLVRDGLRVLHRFGLVTHNPAATYREVRVHQLIQRATYEALTADRRLDVAHRAADALIQAWPDIERDQLGPVLRANTTALRDTTGTALWQRNDKIHQVLDQSAHSLGDALQPEAAFAEFTQLHLATEEIFGPDHVSTLDIRLKSVYWRGSAGDTAGAVAAFEELLADMLRALGPDHNGTLVTRYELANCRVDNGDINQAVVELKDLLADSVRIRGANDKETLTIRFGLAQAQQSAGDPAGAEAMFRELLADDTRILGPDHPFTLVDRYSLALLQETNADVVTALEQLLADDLRVFGPNHPEVFVTRLTLAQRRAIAGDSAAAMAELEELLADQTRLLGTDHPSTRTTRIELLRQASLYARALSEQARQLTSSHRHEEAVAAYEEAIRLAPGHAGTHRGLGNVLHRLGRHEEAVAAYEEAIRLAPGHAGTHRGLGNVLHRLG
ncbi:tetratricopeptide repeat protein, partial [Streptosporangium sp. NPDC023963]|uniref:tetratricopeptide repeat protein n=1 Tax=Streptosporangium sp. NPDC023963 TaxID=3155608 RepID=UPI0034188085